MKIKSKQKFINSDIIKYKENNVFKDGIGV